MTQQRVNSCGRFGGVEGARAGRNAEMRESGLCCGGNRPLRQRMWQGLKRLIICESEGRAFIGFDEDLDAGRATWRSGV